MGLHASVNPNFARAMFIVGHLGIPFAIYELWKLGLCWQLFAVIIVSYIYEFMGGLGITAGAHRLWTHSSYEATYPFRFFLMLCNTITFQGEIYHWSIDHRVHHKYSDTDADPHNATRGFFFSHIGWLFLSRHPACSQAMKKAYKKDLENDPVVTFQLKYYPILALILRFVIPITIGYTITNNWKIGLFFNALSMWSMSLNHTFLVNSLAHMPQFGFRPYDKTIYPTENKTVIYMTLGEGHHNFHHAFPNDYATSELSWDQTFNPSKLVIDIGAKLGMVTLRKRTKYDERKKEWITKKLINNEPDN